MSYLKGAKYITMHPVLYDGSNSISRILKGPKNFKNKYSSISNFYIGFNASKCFVAYSDSFWIKSLK